MSFPGVPIIRVGYMAPRLPYPVAVNLPPAGGPDIRTEIRTEGPNLDIVLPQDTVRHEKLGSSWKRGALLRVPLCTYLSSLFPLTLATLR
jgi:hypothetical protein